MNASPSDNVRRQDGEVETMWTGATVTHRFVEACGLRWHAATTGDPTNAQAVVFLHGFPESWFAWHHQLTALGPRFFCLALDLKGYGQSDTRLDSNYDYRVQALELPAVFDAFGIDECFVVAHDRGAVIADHLTAVPAMADRIVRYVRMQQSGNRPHSDPRPPHDLFRTELGAQLISDGTIARIAYGVEPNPAGHHTLVAKPIDPRDIDGILTDVTAPGVGNSMSASFVSADFDRELDDRMNTLFTAMTMPVLFLQGALDPGQQPCEYDTIVDAVTNGHLEFVDAGHFPHLEAPDATATAIEGFLTRDLLVS